MRVSEAGGRFGFNDAPRHFPYREFALLEKESSRQLVVGAETDADKQFVLGQYLVEGQYEFKQNAKLGIEYLKRAIAQGSRRSLVYYAELVIKGKVVLFSERKVRKLVDKHLDSGDPTRAMLLGKLSRRMGEHGEAIRHMEAAYDAGEAESACVLGNMRMNGEGFDKDMERGVAYYREGISRGSPSAKYKYGKYLIINKVDFQAGVDYIWSAAKDGLCKAICDYGLLLWETLVSNLQF